MIGENDHEKAGIIPRLLQYLFKQLEMREDTVKVSIQYLQIYNGHAYDLLDKKAKKSKNLIDLK